MPKCSVRKCKNNTLTTLKKDGISYFRFPKNEIEREKWRKIIANERSEDFFKPNDSSVVCSCHFSENDMYYTKKGFRKINKGVLPCIAIEILTTQFQNVSPGSARNEPSTSRVDDNSESTEARPPMPGSSAGPSSSTPPHDQDSSDTNLSTPDHNPLKKGSLEQCRFCGEFRKDCIDLATDHKPYLESYKTSLTVNSLNIELDFNDVTLPKTVCSDCDWKLEEMTDFVKKVIDAQTSLINVAEEMETLVVKVESAQTDHDENEVEDPLEVSQVFTHKRKSVKAEAEQKKRKAKNQSDDQQVNTDITDTQGNSVSNVDNTVFSHKRKSNVTDTGLAKGKIFKIDIPLQRHGNVRHEQRENNEFNQRDIETDTAAQGKHVSNVTEDTEFMIDIKEETTETEETHTYEERLECDEDVKPDEAELASNALVYEMSKS